MHISEIVSAQKKKLSNLLDREERLSGEIIVNNGDCQILSQSQERFDLIVYDDSLAEPIEFTLKTDVDNTLFPDTKSEFNGWNRYSYACLLQIENELHLLDPKSHNEHQRYSREGMMRRVLTERRIKADRATYHIEWAKNIYGDHVLTNEKGAKYRIFLRDFENETGYSDSPDARKNKLGTTKHLMYAFRKLKETPGLMKRMSTTYPFIEIFCDPLNDYRVSWNWPHTLEINEQALLSRYFKNKRFINDEALLDFLSFFEEAEELPRIHIRPEVREKVEQAYERKLLADIGSRVTLSFDNIKANLYDYQKEGVRFVTFKKEDFRLHTNPDCVSCFA